MQRRLTRSRLIALALCLICSAMSWSAAEASDNTPEEPVQEEKINLPLITDSINPSVASVSTPAWNEYSHHPYGITFQYPSDWTVSVPDFESMAKPQHELLPGYSHDVNWDYLQTLGHYVSIQPVEGSGWTDTEISISLEPYTISTQTTLREYANLIHQLSAIENPLASETKHTSVALQEPGLLGRENEVIFDVTENSLLSISTLWFQQGDLVFRLQTFSDDPKVIELLEAIAASIEFDDAQIKDLRAKAPFSGDEASIREALQRLQPAEPTCDIVCQDAEAYREIINGSTDSDVADYELGLGSALDEPANEAEPTSISAYRPSMKQKALPADWITPITGAYPFSFPVLCGSSLHINNAEFAVDASVNIGTPVYAAYGGVVEQSYRVRLDTVTWFSFVLR